MATAGLPPAGRHERGRFGSAGLCAGIVERGRGLLGDAHHLVDEADRVDADGLYRREPAT